MGERRSREVYGSGMVLESCSTWFGLLGSEHISHRQWLFLRLQKEMGRFKEKE